MTLPRLAFRPLSLLVAGALLILLAAPVSAQANDPQWDDEPEMRRAVAPLLLEAGMFVENGGLVGIGTSNPQARLHVNSNTTSVIRMQNTGGVRLEFRDDTNNVQWDFRTTSGNAFAIARLTPAPAANMMLVRSDGDMVLAGSLLTQNGVNTYPDYVFEEDYPLMPLSEVAAFISEHRHLPGVQSQADVAAAGAIDMSELQLQLLRKVEELTLYTVAQQQLIDTLEARLAAIERQPADGASTPAR
jgi:hypothetical protein